ncbi:MULTISPECIES: XdhC family protein [unclassified Leptolyngbya]|uniref:XdhC family protein n=1 Tax=unclassified Leptolyngbya TaxID=2650499 RepID=UPI001684D8EE|nr:MULTISPECIES: XdhC family protein [unclassified Leptolyngbya]MBD1914113.1 hypothetical protein [Leptolyngbya sp. FACHB-8]MBD2158150.1 hypothetical protein [Leptolyngbya sp. FACHB-16]
MSSVDFYHQLAKSLHQGAVVLATVTHVTGSVPREVGAKMIVYAGGETFSTIGGGAGEAKVIRHALIVLETGEKQSVEIDLSGAPYRETQGICGGMMWVWLERWQGEDAIARTHQILTKLQAGQSITLVTPLAQNQLPYVQNASLDGSCTPLPEAFVETIQPPPLLLIVGAGHVGEKLAIVARLAGFQIAVQDDRPSPFKVLFYLF